MKNSIIAFFFSKDSRGYGYVSTIEGLRVPFYGVQWHPEKAMFEWGVKNGR